MPASFAADVGESTHEQDVGGKGKGKSKVHWDEDGSDGTPGYGLSGTSRSL